MKVDRRVAERLIAAVGSTVIAAGCIGRNHAKAQHGSVEVVIPSAPVEKPKESDEVPLPSRVGGEMPAPAPPPVATVGLRECDQYLTKLERCIRQSFPLSNQEPSLKSLETMRETFRQLRDASPEDAARVCQQIDDASAESMRNLGCAW